MLSTSVFYIWLLLIAVVLVKYHWSKRKFYLLAWSLNGPISLPVVGDAFRLLVNDDEILKIITNVSSLYQSPIKFWLGPKLAVLLTDIRQVESVLSSMAFINKDEVYRFIQTFNGEGLVSSSGTKWKKDRQLISPIFADKKLKKYFPICVQHAKAFVEVLKSKVDQESFNVEKYLHRCAGDITSEVVLGFEAHAQKGSIDLVLETISRAMVLIHSRISKVWLQNDLIYNILGYGKIQQKYLDIIHGHFKYGLNIAKDRYNKNKDLINEDESIHPIIHYLLQLRDNIPSFATDQELIHHIGTFYAAGVDTTTIISSFTLVLLGMYPHIQSKVADELRQVFGPEPREVQLEDLHRLEYLSMCIKDVLRLFPIAPFIMREASEDFQIGKWVIPKGCSIMISIYNLHRSAEHWEKPNEFYPEHFLPEAVSNRSSCAFIPFSSGLRACIGRPLAYMAIQTVLATTLQHYEVEADGTLQDKELKADISTRFKDDTYPIRIKRRIYYPSD